jgi:hypothetical protein
VYRERQVAVKANPANCAFVRDRQRSAGHRCPAWRFAFGSLMSTRNDKQRVDEPTIAD